MTLLLILSLLLVYEPAFPEVYHYTIPIENYGTAFSLIVEEESEMYLVWNENNSRDSIFQGEFSWNEYDKTKYIKSLKSMEQVMHYSDDNRDDFNFLFTEFPSSRFKNYTNKVSAIVFHGTTTHKKLLDEIRYITLDERFNVHSSAGIMPVYEGGYQGILDYFNHALNSEADRESPKPLTGDVVLGFVVDKEGQVDCVKILESSNEELDRRAYDMVKSMPGWSPARNGYPVPVFLGIQLIFFSE